MFTTKFNREIQNLKYLKPCHDGQHMKNFTRFLATKGQILVVRGTVSA